MNYNTSIRENHPGDRGIPMNPIHVFCGRNQPNGVRLVFYFSLLCTLLSCGACEKTPVKPSNITSNDVCFHCKSPISDVTFAAELIANNGFPRKFDDISCLIADAKKLGRKNILAIYATDAQSRTLFPIQEVQLVHSDKLRTPQNGGIVAFKDPARAQAFVTRFHAEAIKLDDLLH
jgi:hypothetical protein